jgi:hypothetical protein
MLSGGLLNKKIVGIPQDLTLRYPHKNMSEIIEVIQKIK